MIVPEKDDSASDISSNSSWTVLGENEESTERVQYQTAEDVTEISEVFECVAKTESVVSEDKNKESGEHSEADDNEEAQGSESGFLTLEEFVQQRELEHDYEFDENIAHFKELLKKSDSKSKQKSKKSKAGQIGTLSVMGTVLAVTGLSFLCLLVPSDNPSASAADNVKSKLPNFSEVENSINYTCPVYKDEDDTTLKIIDDGGFIKKVLSRNNHDHKNQGAKLNTTGPMRREEFLKKHVPLINRTKIEFNKFVTCTTRHQQTVNCEANNTNKSNFYRKGKNLPLKNSEILVNPNHHLQTGSATKSSSETERKQSRFSFLQPLLGNGLACQMCQDLILLKMLSALRKGKTYSEVEKIVREKRKYLKKESAKKDRKQLRLLKVNHYDSHIDLEYEAEGHISTKVTQLKKSLKKLNTDEKTLEYDVGGYKSIKATSHLKKAFNKLDTERPTKAENKLLARNEAKAKNKISKKDGLKMNVDLRHVPPIQQLDNKRTLSTALLTARSSIANKQKVNLDDQKHNHEKETKTIDYNQQNVSRKELRNNYENIKKMENELETTLSCGNVTVDQKIESLRNIRKARENFIESLKRNRDEFKKQTVRKRNLTKPVDLNDTKNVAVGYYKVPDVDNSIVNKKLQELQEMTGSYDFPFCHNDKSECECKTPKSNALEQQKDAAVKTSKTEELEQRTLDNAHHIFEAYNRWTAKARKANSISDIEPLPALLHDGNLAPLTICATNCLGPKTTIVTDPEIIEMFLRNEVIVTDSDGKIRKRNKSPLQEATALSERASQEEKPNSKHELTESSVKQILDGIIKEALKETRRNRKRKHPRNSVSETDVNHADDEMSSSDSSVGPLKTENSDSLEKNKKPVKNNSEMIVSQPKCRQADALYYCLFGGKGQEIINKDQTQWSLKRHPSVNCMKQVSKQDPKKCYVPKVTKF